MIAHHICSFLHEGGQQKSGEILRQLHTTFDVPSIKSAIELLANRRDIEKDHETNTWRLLKKMSS